VGAEGEVKATMKHTLGYYLINCVHAVCGHEDSANTLWARSDPKREREDTGGAHLYVPAINVGGGSTDQYSLNEGTPGTKAKGSVGFSIAPYEQKPGRSLMRARTAGRHLLVALASADDLSRRIN